MNFKNERDKSRIKQLTPVLAILLDVMETWADQRNLPFVITETWTTKEEDSALQRVSSSHREKRAVDVSAREWNLNDILEFTEFFNEKYAHIAAISLNTMRPALVVYHDSGYGAHFHVQAHPKFKVVG